MTDTTPPAGLARSLTALLYELLLTAAVLLACSALLTPLKAALGDGVAAEWLFRLALLALLFAYYGFCWTHGGQTLAMKTWRLRLVRADGAALGWPDAARRFACAILLFIGVPALVWAGWSRALAEPAPLWLLPLWLALPFVCRLIDPAHCTLHDRLAGTRVLLLPRRR